MVPMVFVYSPAMLLVLDDYFTWGEFVQTTGTCVLGIVMLGAALVGYVVAPMAMGLRLLLGVAAILMVAPDWGANLWSIVLALPVVLSQILHWRRGRAAATVPP